MKIFRYLGMAMFAMMLSVNFAACSSSDDDGDGNESIEKSDGKGNENDSIDYVQKYISEQKSKYADPNYSNHSISERTFYVSYNNTLLTGIKCLKDNEQDEDWEIDYGSFLITRDLGRIIRTYPFMIGDNGCITTIQESNSSYNATTQYIYNENRQLTGQITDTKYGGALDNLNGIRTYIYTWQDGNLIKIEFTYQGGDNIADTSYSNIEYGNIANKGKIVPPGCMYFYSIGDISNIFMSSGLFGEVSKKLPTRVTTVSKYNNLEYTSVTNFTYEFDEHGFVKSVNTDAETGFINSSFTYKN